MAIFHLFKVIKGALTEMNALIKSKTDVNIIVNSFRLAQLVSVLTWVYLFCVGITLIKSL